MHVRFPVAWFSIVATGYTSINRANRDSGVFRPFDGVLAGKAPSQGKRILVIPDISRRNFTKTWWAGTS
jgi:hypothetical protein